ncbi:hypothetical protein BRADI_4g03455v3 [Brachypodium distachyon]|uniref:Uncharacterized protein n=1 Tax=Brachypodium distachyon TaxID=15368 RepID=A0A0Q3L199_BRADI|nr:hypothetical protein BRADI_4g03455v3 [Brachypodium distachyon]
MIPHVGLEPSERRRGKKHHVVSSDVCRCAPCCQTAKVQTTESGWHECKFILELSGLLPVEDRMDAFHMQISWLISTLEF